MACKSTTPLLQLLLMTALVTGCRGLHIIELEVPAVIQNGSQSSVLLDCKYHYERYEEDGLVVKWFWNHEPEAVYQWIPGKRPEAMGVLKGRVNLDFPASKDKYSQHRALEILHPTTELTGDFTCRVSSFHDEEYASKRMIVYAPATSMNVSYHKPTPDTVNITCDAHGIYPQPRLLLFRGTNARTRKSIGEAKVETVEGEVGYSVFLEALLQDRSLRQETVFECVLSIPDTEYQVRRKIIYFPGYAALGSYGGATVSPPLPLFLLLLPSLLLLAPSLRGPLLLPTAR